MENKLTASELRIGNLVEYEGEIYEIDTISKLFPTLNTVAFGIGVVGWDNLNPIPLNEEWLLKFGFTKKENRQYWYKEDSMLRFALLDGCLHCSIGDDENGVLYNRLYFVHQLQNLFYAINNKELTIK